MKLAIIDIGSNTIRLCVYTLSPNGQIIMLFSKKEMAGLANYVQGGLLTQDGIDRACMALAHFKFLLEQVEVDRLDVFATASIRNVGNSTNVLAQIKERTGISVVLLSGNDETKLGYYGVLQERPVESASIFDIGGGSTEVSLVKSGKLKRGKSFPIGSLQLYRENVKNIWPTRQELRAMHQATLRAIDLAPYKAQFPKHCLMVGVGGSARAVLKCANICLRRSRDEKELGADEFRAIHDLLIKRDKTARDLVIRACPDRMHTLLPGLCIMDTVVKALKPRTLYIAGKGVREGYARKVFQEL